MKNAPLWESGALVTNFGVAWQPPNNTSPPASQQKMPLLPYAPWSTADQIECGKQLRTMATLVHVIVGPGHPLFTALRAGETDPTQFVEAQALLEALPSLTRRRLLSTFAAVTWPRQRRGGEHERPA